MKKKKFYLTTPVTDEIWNCVSDLTSSHPTMDVGLIRVKKKDIKVDKFGIYTTETEGSRSNLPTIKGIFE